MEDPVIKREESPEASIMAIPPVSTATSAVTASTASVSSTSDSEDVKPPRTKPYLVANPAQAAPSAYHGSSPSKYHFGGSTNTSSRPFDRTPFGLARLPSRQTSAIATGSVNKAITTTAKHSTLPTLKRITQLLQNNVKDTTQENNKMDEHHGEETAIGDDTNFPILPPMIDLLEQDDATQSLPRGGFADVHTHLQVMQHVADQRQVISELITFNQNVHVLVQQLNDRMAKVESENSYLRSLLTSNASKEVPQLAPTILPTFPRRDTDGRSRSPSLTQPEHQECTDNDEESDSVKNAEARKQLGVQLPGMMFAPPLAVGLPTPLTKSAKNLSASTLAPSRAPKTAITPGRIGPVNTKKSTTSITKRKIHNLNQIVPPPFVQIPIVPLTDTEIIVYFFQSLARPIVALRLYARNWGPASIIDVLNDHRVIDPPYLRNTCSVKCTTAIKKGNEKFGKEWEDTHRQVFRAASDVKATDMIHLSGDEVQHAVDYDLRSLTVGLRKHPQEGEDGGIFTRCVQYCEATGAAYTMVNVWELAADLQAGRIPKHPASPERQDFAGRSQHRQKKQKVVVRSPSPGSVMGEEDAAAHE
ncbi:Nn.00g030570.m01.CDS01 [Neocucurbitaria sp. VM-36]